MRLVSALASRELDRRTRDEALVAEIQLMEGAGLRAWSAFRDEFRAAGLPDGRFLFLCGRGNNAGDALVMARYAHYESERELMIVLAEKEGELSDPRGSELFDRQLRTVRALGIPVYTAKADGTLAILRAVSGAAAANGPGPEAGPSPASRQEPETDLSAADFGAADFGAADFGAAVAGAAVVFDGIAGSGLRGSLAEPYASLVSAVNGRKGRAIVVAIDLPSGLGDDWKEGYPAVRADLTLAIELPKTCCYYPRARACAGKVRAVAGVFPPSLVAATRGPVLLNDEAPGTYVAPISRDAYKNQRGFVAVFAGREGTTGAAVLSAGAAGRAGAGLVRLFVQRAVYGIVAGRLGGAMAEPWDPDGDPSLFDARPYSAFLAGPGWGTTERNGLWLSALVRSGLPGVLDADAIALFPRITGLVSAGTATPPNGALRSPLVLTPHPGEFARLTGTVSGDVLASPERAVLEAAGALGCVIVLKSHVTWIADPDGRLAVYDGREPAMATGGSGDVLAGIIAGILASGASAFEAACAGVMMHAEAGVLAKERSGLFLAEELCEAVSVVAARYRMPAD